MKKSYAILGNTALLTCKTKMGQSYPLTSKVKTLKVSKPPNCLHLLILQRSAIVHEYSSNVIHSFSLQHVLLLSSKVSLQVKENHVHNVFISLVGNVSTAFHWWFALSILQLAAMVTFVWLVVLHPMRGEWRCAKMATGVQSVMMDGGPPMHKWSADN